MGMDKLTSKFQQTLMDAQSFALDKQHATLEPEHVLWVMLTQENSAVLPILKQAGANIPQLKSVVEDNIDSFGKMSQLSGEIRPSESLLKLFNICDVLGKRGGDAFISSELFLLAILEEKGKLAKLFEKANLKGETLKAVIQSIRGD